MNTANPPLLELRDIHLPAAPPWWPPAPGWWLLAALALILLVLTAGWLLRAWNRQRRRRALSAALHALEQGLTADPAPQRLAELSALLKRLALKRHSQREVAALSGSAWLAFLDRTGGEGAFSAGPGRALAEQAYRAELTDGLDVPGLMRAASRWIERNLGGSA